MVPSVLSSSWKILRKELSSKVIEKSAPRGHTLACGEKKIIMLGESINEEKKAPNKEGTTLLLWSGGIISVFGIVGVIMLLALGDNATSVFFFE